MPLISRLIRRKVDMKSSSADTTTVERKFFPWAREENFHFSRLLFFSFAFPPVLKINNFEQRTHNSMPVLRRDVLRVVTFAFFSFLLASRSYTMYDNDNGFGKTTRRLDSTHRYRCRYSFRPKPKYHRPNIAVRRTCTAQSDVISANLSFLGKHAIKHKSINGHGQPAAHA